MLVDLLAEAEHASRAARTVSLWLEAQLYLAEPAIRLDDVEFSFEGSALEDGLQETVADCLALARMDAAQQRLEVAWLTVGQAENIECTVGPFDVAGRHIEHEHANTRHHDVTSIGRGRFRL